MKQKPQIWKCIIWAVVLAGTPVVFVVLFDVAKLCQAIMNRTFNGYWYIPQMSAYFIMGLFAAEVAGIRRRFLYSWIVRLGGLIGLLLSVWLSFYWVLIMFFYDHIRVPSIGETPLFNIINYAIMTMLFGIYLVLSVRMGIEIVRDRQSAAVLKKTNTMTHILMVIDMQNDFIDGALGTTEAVQIVPGVADKVRRAVENGDEIYFTQDTHTDTYADTLEGKNLPVPHCIAGTHGWEICDALKPYVKDGKCVKKITFGAAELANLLQNRTDIAQIEVCGLGGADIFLDSLYC